MKQIISFCAVFFLVTCVASAQDFITRGKIEYEIKKNYTRMFSDMGHNPLGETQFRTHYRELIFSENKSIYLPGKGIASESIYSLDHSVFTDLAKKELLVKKRTMTEEYFYTDTLGKIKWKLENEVRKIAGFTCRKAVGRIYDSVYVVAFYCPEIIPQGGPEMFSGLPGMILGLAIPRYYTTWFATKVEVVGVDESKIVPPARKKEKLYTRQELKEMIFKMLKDSYWKNFTIEKAEREVSQYVLDGSMQ